MQRKNSILMPLKSSMRNSFRNTYRKAMAMIMAIGVIVIIGTIMALSIALTTQTSKRTVDVYLYEQAILYSKSAAELMLEEIADNGCKDSHSFLLGNSGEIQYDANITMQYIYTGAVGGCTNYFNIATPEQNGSVLMDITVTLHDQTIVSEPIRYFRRTIQKL